MYEILLDLPRLSLVGSRSLRQRKMTYFLAYCTTARDVLESVLIARAGH